MTTQLQFIIIIIIIIIIIKHFLEGKIEGRENEEGDVSSYWVKLSKPESNGH